MAFRIIILTQHAPIYIGPFFDKFLSHLNHEKFELVSIIAFSPIFKSSTLEEAKARMAMYGLRSFLKMSSIILVEKIRVVLYSQLRVGRCSSIRNVAQKFKIPIVNFDDPNSDDFLKYVRDNEINLLLSIACPKILKAKTLVSAKNGTLNYHTGGLPKYRGRQPIFWAKLNGDQQIGITAHEMVPSLDAGPIVCQEWIHNSKEESLHDTYLKTIEVGPRVLIDAIEKLEKGDSDRIDNPDSLSTKFSFPSASDGREYRKKGYKFI